MNVDRRKQITEINNKLANLKMDIESLEGDEQNSLDALPEGMRDGEKADKMTNAIDALQSAASSLEEATGYLDTAAE